MIKGLAITPPILGRISIGKVVEKNGKRLPEKDDQFTLTTQVQGKDGWIPHPLDAALRQGSEGKLRAIPIRLLFNEPDLNLRAEYCLFDRNTGRPMCSGNGETCRRVTLEGMVSLPCPSPEGCELAKAGCKPYGRLNVGIEDAEAGGAGEDLGSFIFRTTGFNSIRTLSARLRYYQAVSGNCLACLPLMLVLRAKTTTLSHRSAIYYADITVREGLSLEGAIAQAKALQERREAAGYEQSSLDDAARLGMENGAFEESEEEGREIVEEFFPEDGDSAAERAGAASATSTTSTNPATGSTRASATTDGAPRKLSLREKLDQKALAT